MHGRLCDGDEHASQRASWTPYTGDAHRSEGRGEGAALYHLCTPAGPLRTCDRSSVTERVIYVT